MNKINLNHVKILNNLRLSQVTKVYAGKPGCACGCKGSYSDAPKAQRRFDNMRTFVNNRIWEKTDHSMMGDSIEEGENWISFETESKVYTVYFRAE